MNHKRIHRTKDSTLGMILFDDFQCWVLEDGWRPAIIRGETRIPAGRYEIRLRTQNSTMHQQYGKKFPWHKGMLEITGIPGFGDVYYHIGNTVGDTLGCPLVGSTPVFKDGIWTVSESTKAYEAFYKRVLAMLGRGPVFTQITDEE